MNRVIRQGVFETNSSSSHSICIARIGTLDATLHVDEDGVCNVFTGEFGWEVCEYTDAPTKAAYCLTYAKGCGNDSKENKSDLSMLESVIMKQTGAKSVVFVEGDDSYYKWGYIDHQSDAVCYDAFKDEETLSNFIFNSYSTLMTDNDNH